VHSLGVVCGPGFGRPGARPNFNCDGTHPASRQAGREDRCRFVVVAAWRAGAAAGPPHAVLGESN